MTVLLRLSMFYFFNLFVFFFYSIYYQNKQEFNVTGQTPLHPFSRANTRFATYLSLL